MIKYNSQIYVKASVFIPVGEITIAINNNNCGMKGNALFLVEPEAVRTRAAGPLRSCYYNT